MGNGWGVIIGVHQSSGVFCRNKARVARSEKARGLHIAKPINTVRQRASRGHPSLRARPHSPCISIYVTYTLAFMSVRRLAVRNNDSVHTAFSKTTSTTFQGHLNRKNTKIKLILFYIIDRKPTPTHQTSQEPKRGRTETKPQSSLK